MELLHFTSKGDAEYMVIRDADEDEEEGVTIQDYQKDGFKLSFQGHISQVKGSASRLPVGHFLEIPY